MSNKIEMKYISCLDHEILEHEQNIFHNELGVGLYW